MQRSGEKEHTLFGQLQAIHYGWGKEYKAGEVAV